MLDARHFAQRALRLALVPALSMAVSGLPRENAVVFGLVSEHIPARARWIPEFNTPSLFVYREQPGCLYIEPMAMILATYSRGDNPGVGHMPSIRECNHQQVSKSRWVKSHALPREFNPPSLFVDHE